MRAGARIVAAAALSGALILTGTSCKIQVGEPSASSSANQQDQAPANSVIHKANGKWEDQGVMRDHLNDKDWKADGKTINPTAIVLHWTDGTDNNSYQEVITGLNGNRTGFSLDSSRIDPYPKHHTTVQFTVMRNGTAWQLTPKPNTQARHATCANAYAIGIEIKGSAPGSRNYIGNYPTQLKGVVALVKELQHRYHIPTRGVVAADGRTGSGILTHAMVDAKCTLPNGQHYGTGKIDVDQIYYRRVLAALK